MPFFSYQLLKNPSLEFLVRGCFLLHSHVELDEMKHAFKSSYHIGKNFRWRYKGRQKTKRFFLFAGIVRPDAFPEKSVRKLSSGNSEINAYHKTFSAYIRNEMRVSCLKRAEF